MKHKVIVLGCGLVGATMARDLAGDSEFEVSACDLDGKNLERLFANSPIRTVQADLSDPNRVGKVVEPFDLVVGGLPSAIGFSTLKAVIEARKPYCDITFMPENPMELDDLAKENGVTAVVDCGVSPGLSHMIIGYVDAQLDRTERAEIYVGGLPRIRQLPYEYKAPFAPSDVLEVYMRPARLIENGKLTVRPALSETELMDFAEVGTLEAFNTDGLRSLLSRSDIGNMKEKTLRYPGHAKLMSALRDTGLLNETEIEVNGVQVRPLDVTSQLLFPKWKYAEGEEDFTILRVIVEGVLDGQPVRHTYDLYDEYDRETNTSSMARTTAFPNVLVARMVASGRFCQPGVIAPEQFAADKSRFEDVVAGLKSRGVNLTCTIDRI